MPDILSDYFFCPKPLKCKGAKHQHSNQQCKGCLRTANCCKHNLPSLKCEFQPPCEILQIPISEMQWVKAKITPLKDLNQPHKPEKDFTPT